MGEGRFAFGRALSFYFGLRLASPIPRGDEFGDIRKAAALAVGACAAIPIMEVNCGIAKLIEVGGRIVCREVAADDMVTDREAGLRGW